MITSYFFRRRQTIAVGFLLLFSTELFAPNFLWGTPLPPLFEANHSTGHLNRGIWERLNPLKNKVDEIKGPTNEKKPFGPDKTYGKERSINNKRRSWIGGPGQPEMQAFQSVNASNMVDLFSGDFSYNIPLMDVGGYPIGISYRAGITMDQEASWVGLGWNINPGTIMRNVRGLPDDFNGTDSITKELNTKKKWTAGVNVDLGSEIFGKDLKKFLSNPTVGFYYDNYSGPGFQASIKAGVNAGRFAMGTKTYGIGEFSLGVSFDSKSGFNVNPTYSASLDYKESYAIHGTSSIGLNYNSRSGLKDLQVMTGGKISGIVDGNVRSAGGTLFSSTISFSSPTFTPPISVPTTYSGFTFSTKLGGELFGLHINVPLTGYYNQNYIAEKDKVQKMPAYGYLNLARSNRDQRALLDVNREKDIPYRDNSPNIAIPIQTYDVFSVSGEGIGGSFRAYRGDVGILADHQMKTKSTTTNIGTDFGAIPNLLIGGVDIRHTNAYTENRRWAQNNALTNKLSFRQSDSTYEAVYFRNPGEQTSNSSEYYQSIGDDDVLRVNLTGDNYDPVASNLLARFNKYTQTGTLQVTQPITKTKRDRRSQVMTYLSAAEAASVGMEKEIHSYSLNSFSLGACDSSYEKISRVDGAVRRAHHISEITVLNPDGRRYIYGIPAYNTIQQEATFAVDKANAVPSQGLVSYNPASDFSRNNVQGKDGYFNLETTPPSAHSFLLTELLSADYVDVTGDGVSDDDIGDAVKFKYTRMKWSGETSFRWRAPMDENKASYNEGMRTDNSDDKGHVVYGEKEIWYLNSIESKTMIATFTLDTDSLRRDGFEVKGIHGGRSTSSTKKLMRLKEINLYSKADLKKLGSKARPVKTVHFAYSYRLCKGYPDLSDMNTGKLTLDSLWFTYNKVNRGKENPYVFKYNTSNPNYQYKAYDRWGNYKPSTDNPGSIPDDDYPYAVKDSTKAATNSAAWCLSDIYLPSGAKMKVDYESDDYAFVQNRRALEMFQVAGFGADSSATPVSDLYASKNQDYRYVFVDVPVSVTDKKDIFAKYLSDIGKLYFKLHVQMPADSYGSGYEYVPVYTTIKNFGKVSSNRIWIELEPSPEGANKSPLATAAIQFLRLNLPSKAYAGSDVKNDPAFVAAVMSVLSIVPEIATLVRGGFNNDARIRSRSKVTLLSRSFVRLSSPALKKYGGGQRVKRITVSDNWSKMTGRKESYYGQEYDYTTTKVVNGKPQIISSGVASYEPSIGNEENPFHQPIEYVEKATLAPSNLMYVEEPYAESLFPSAGVGYSRVRVSSINRKNIKSAPGFEETEFYTAYDFPTLTDHTLFDNNSSKKGIDKFKFASLRTRKNVTQSQGFKIELNDMHGKMKSNSVFAENDPTHFISHTEQFYRCEKINSESYRLVNVVPTLENAPNVFIINNNGQVGKDIELVADMREQASTVQTAELQFNLDKFLVPIPFIPVIMVPSITPNTSIENSRYRSVSLLKVVQRYGIVDSVVVVDKGSKVSTKNLLWDGETGDVLVSRTQNEFNDPIFQANYPAYWAYSGMGPAYKNIDAVLNNVKINGGKVTSVNGGATAVSIVDRMFEPGDEVLVMNTPSFSVLDPCGLLSFNRVTKASQEKRLWVVDRSKVSGDSTRDLYFIDRYGNEYSGHGINIRIIRSGHRNMASTPVGSITSLRSPIKITTIDHIDYSVLSFDSTIGVVAASAAVMKDEWPVEDRFTKLSRCDSLNKIIQTTFSPSSTALVKSWYVTNGVRSDRVYDQTFMDEPYFVASRGKDSVDNYSAKFQSGPGMNDRRTRGIVQFNLNSIPSYATIDSARLDLYGKRPRYLWSWVNYWSHVTRAQTTINNSSELLQIVRPWSTTTTFSESNNITTETNKVTLAASTDSCQDYHPGLTSMIQAMVTDPASNYGILFKEKNLIPFVPNAYLGITHMSFCALGANNRDHDGGTCSTCTPLSLFVKYHYRYDSCYSTCKSIFEGRINPYVQGIWGNWRALRSYVYYDRRVQSDPLSPTNIRRDGEIKSFVPFWVATPNYMKQTTNQYVWVWNAEITRYNRRGLETENRDPLGRFNSGLYGYANTLPIAVAQNSRYREMTYDGFEDYAYTADSCISDCPTPRHFDFTAYKDSIVTTVRHTGKASLRLGANSFASASARVLNGSDTLAPSLSFTRTISGGCTRFDSIKALSSATYPVFTPLPGSTMVLGAWVKEDKDCSCTSYTGNSIDIVFYHGGSLLQTRTKVPTGQIIEGWQRYYDTLAIPSTADSMVVKLKNNTTVAVYFDDLRLHPYNSNMKSFVYHPTNLRLLAELDENNYASFYEYNEEGTLIRVKKETERGIKTIRETRSALQKADQ